MENFSFCIEKFAAKKNGKASLGFKQINHLYLLAKIRIKI
jgi:hypothetical protein